MVAATIKPFTARTPTVVVFETSTNFDGTAPTGTPTVSGGVVSYPIQAGGGLFKLHDKPILILEIAHLGGGSLTSVKKISANSELSVTVPHADLVGTTLMPGEWIVFTSSGSGTKQLVIKAQEVPASVGA
jgi:hypothetical protein